MPELSVLMSGLAFPESPRWHDGRLWFADWGAHEVIALSLDGTSEVVARVESFPMCIDWLPDGRLLIVSSAAQLLLAQEQDGSLVTYADLSGLTDFRWNDIAADGRGHIYVNETGFDFPGGEFAPGRVALVGPDRTARLVAEGVAFPNGMAVTPDGSTLIVAESYGSRLTAFDIRADGGLSAGRVWADLAGGVPDGICIDAEGSVWYADVPHQSCVRVREGGEIQQTVELDRGGFACAIGGVDGRTLFVTTNEWRGVEAAASGARNGQVVTTRVDVPAATAPA